MPRVEVPLLGKKLWATGDILLRAELDLLVRDNNGIWRPETFLIDSGAEVSSMATELARALDLPIPRKAISLNVNGVRREVRTGLIRVQLAGIGGSEHVFPCYFLDAPILRSGANPSPASARNLLGLSGVVDKLRITFDGKPTPGARYGVVVVETP